MSNPIQYRKLTPEHFAAELEEALKRNPPPTQYDEMLERAKRNRAIAELMQKTITI